MLGLVASQLLPGALGTAYPGFKATADTLLYICLGFIMILSLIHISEPTRH